MGRTANSSFNRLHVELRFASYDMGRLIDFRYLWLCCLMTIGGAQDNRSACKSLQYLELGTLGTIECTFNSTYNIIWYNTTDHRNNLPIVSYIGSEKDGRGYMSGEFDLRPNGSLIIKNVSLEHEHYFRAFSTNEDETLFGPYDVSVEVFANPSPAHLIIDGCDSNQYCALNVSRSGSLTCTVNRIRPNVTLQWRTSDETKDDEITFSQSSTKVIEHPNSFTVIVSTEYSAENTTSLNVTAECGTTGQYAGLFNLTSKIVLMLPFLGNKGDKVSKPVGALSPPDVPEHRSVPPYVIAIVIVLVILGMIAIPGLCYKMYRNCQARDFTIRRSNGAARPETSPTEENIPMLPPQPSTPPRNEDTDGGRNVTDGKTPLPPTLPIQGESLESIPQQESLPVSYTSTPQKEARNEDTDGGRNVADVKIPLPPTPPIQGESLESIPQQESLPIPYTSTPKKEGKEILVEQLKGKYQSLYKDVRAVPGANESFHVNELFVVNDIQSSSTLNISREEKWSTFSSYRDIFDSSSSSIVVIEGKIGYGKSMLCYKIAYDWCELTSKKYDILIFMTVDELNKFDSLSRAVKKQLLPVESGLSVKDIENTLQRCSSVLLILDEYEELHTENMYITEIMKQKRYPKFTVAVTTRAYDHIRHVFINVKRYKILGFNEEMRKEYIEKIVREKAKHEKAVKQIEYQLQQNPTLQQLCEVPLLFVAYAHVAVDWNQLQALKVLSELINYLVTCFEHHTYIKHRHHGEELASSQADYFKDLDLLAFRMSTENMSSRHDILGLLPTKEIYNQYIRGGMLYEVRQTNNGNGDVTVKFYNELFAEWYLARHIANLSKEQLPAIFAQLDETKIYYVKQFVCSQNPLHAAYIIGRLKSTEGGEFPAMWCKLAQTRDYDDIAANHRRHCGEKVKLDRTDSNFIQRSRAELLAIASDKKVPVASVELHGCLNLEDSTENRLGLISGIRIPILDTLEKMTISEDGMKMTDFADVVNIFTYASQCNELKEMILLGILLPHSIPSSRTLMKHLRSRKVKVEWTPVPNKPDETYRLNLEHGLWMSLKYGNKQMKMNHYKKLVDSFWEHWKPEVTDIESEQPATTVV